MVFLMLVLAGCAPAPSDDLVGTWVHHAADGESAELELRADGTATATAVPVAVFVPTSGGIADVNWAETVSGSGQWEVDADHDLQLTIVDAVDDRQLGPQLFVDSHGLFAYLGPAESAVFRFTRE